MSKFEDDLRKVDRTDKVQELTRVFREEVLDTRRWSIAQVYGEDVAATYTPLREERDFFVDNGRLPHPEDFRFDEEVDAHAKFKAWNDGFWAHCAAAYPERLQAYLDRKAANVAAWQGLSGAANENKRLTELQAYIAEKLKKLKG